MSLYIILSTLGIIFSGLLVYMFYIEPLLIKVSRTEIHLPDLPNALDGFTICHISDTHCTGYGLHEKVLHGVLSGLEADLCVITGDIVQSYDGLKVFPLILDEFHPRLGMYAVPGNGEHKYKLDIGRIDSEFAESGIKLLQNNNTYILTNGCRINIIGVDDPYYGLSDLRSAIDGTADADLNILISHSPDIAAELGDYRPDMIFAGHTHGGQIRFPFIGAFWLHSRYNLKLSHGYYSPENLSELVAKGITGVHMYISRGIGASLIRARLLCPPEVAVITLRCRFK